MTMEEAGIGSVEVLSANGKVAIEIRRITKHDGSTGHHSSQCEWESVCPTRSKSGDIPPTSSK